MLLDIGYDRILINNKLALIAGKTKRDAGELIRSSAGTVMAFGERVDEARELDGIIAILPWLVEAFLCFYLM